MTATPCHPASLRARRLWPVAALCAGFACLTSHAADEPDPVVTLDKFTTSARAADVYGVLPERETPSVLGTSRSQQDTPRSVTLVESTLIDLYGIQTVNVFVAITAGTFTGNYF